MGYEVNFDKKKLKVKLEKEWGADAFSSLFILDGAT